MDILGWFPRWGCCKRHCCEHSCAVFARTCVCSSRGHTPVRGITRSQGGAVFDFLRNRQTVFRGSCFSFPPATSRRSGLPASSPALVIVCLFDSSHPRACGVLPGCACEMHPPATSNLRPSLLYQMSSVAFPPPPPLPQSPSPASAS